MKFLRHILSHLILISFLIALISVFYYRTLLLPSDVVVKVEGITKQIYPPALSFVSKRDYFWSIRGERIVSFDDLNLFEKNDGGVKEAKATKTEKIEPQKVSVMETQDVPKVEEKAKPVLKPEIMVEKEVEKKTTNVVSSKKETIEKAAIVVVKEDDSLKEVVNQVNVAIVVKDKDEKTSVVVKDSDTSSERDLLISARNAFNHGDMLKSESFYIQLTELDHDDADIFGELGNVYYSQGKWDDAGQAYYEAAIRLITERKHEQVNYLQRVIRGLNTELAEKLAQRISRR